MWQEWDEFRSLSEVLTTAGVDRHSCVLTSVKTQLYLSGVLDHCVHILSLDPRRLRDHRSSVTTLAQLTRYFWFIIPQKPWNFKQSFENVCLSSYCCIGVEPGQRLEMFNRVFLPSVMDGLLSLASHLMRQTEVRSFFLSFFPFLQHFGCKWAIQMNFTCVLTCFTLRFIC